MPERHTVDFVKLSIGIVSDDERRTITLQVNTFLERRGPIEAILCAIRGRFDPGLISRLAWWRERGISPFLLPKGTRPHPDEPDVLCFEMGVRAGERVESALALLLEFLREQPGYRRTFGVPLDRDLPIAEPVKASPRELSEAATAALKEMLRRRR